MYTSAGSNLDTLAGVMSCKCSISPASPGDDKVMSAIADEPLTRSSATAKSTACLSCLVGVLYDISRERIC